MSIFSITYWIKKGLSESEAKYQIAIRRPNNILYYINKGYSEEEAKQLVKDRQSVGGAKRKAMSNEEKRKLSPRCIEFWLSKGLSYNDAAEKLKDFQKNFSKEICIEKYGEEEGLRIWSERQRKWQHTLNSKSEEELNDINQRKNRWKNLSEDESKKLKEQVGKKVKNTVSQRPKEKTEEIFERVINSKIKLGHCMPRDQLPEFEKYKRKVWRITRKNQLSLLENYEKRGRKNYHLDHMYSVWQGFLDNTPPEIVGHICNLKMIPYKENISKHISCSVTLDELINLISKY
jgi:hypothetical protein